MTIRRMCVSSLLILLLSTLISAAARAGDEWQPIDPAELRMTSEPLAPGAPAIYLYRQVDRNDSGRTTHTEFNYVRIKILTEEGRKYANVEIPYSKAVTGIGGIRARTIHADGSIVNFEGKILENTIVKSKTVKYLAKTFAMPDAQVGSIIEYRYTYDFEDYYIYWSKWMLSEELFTKKAVFSLKPYERFAVQWNWPVGLPAGTEPPKQGPDLVVRLTAVNVPAFQEEDHMPPENELKFLVNFVYSEDGFESDPVRFWKKYGEKQNKQTEKFVDRRKAMEQAVSQIISPSDSADTKLRKIYARCQQVKNLSFERNQDKAKEEKVKPNENVEDVWKRGVGSGHDVNLLFLALVRAAGFEAYYVRLSGRSEYFFNQKRMNTAQLDADTVLVKSEGKDLYLDPATKFAPYGLMPWPETGVAGLRLDKQGGTWIQTEIPESFASKVVRQADLKLSEEGGLEGQVKVTYCGLEALDRRLGQRFGDDTQRKEYLENALKNVIPATAEVELKNKPDWDSSGEKLVAEYDVKIPGWASPAGRRVVLPLGLFAGAQKHVFEHSQRTHAIYFSYMFQTEDQVKITLPTGWKVGNLPKEVHLDAKAAEYQIQAENKENALQVTRTLRSDIVLLQSSLYPALRDFYQKIRSGDEQEAVLQPGANSAAN
ncbi:MAG TPA: DUF3857 domain-containing protein [Candidatus Acidoferrum sp.]|nr:DUF3857 domain-containing protein [Candidatus Acidoferrum sp.]